MGNCISADQPRRVHPSAAEEQETARPAGRKQSRAAVGGALPMTTPQRRRAKDSESIAPRAPVPSASRLMTESASASGANSTLEMALASINRTRPGHPQLSLQDIRQKDFEIPPRVYRAAVGDASEIQKEGILSGRGQGQTDDEYLASIIKHTSRTSGSGGDVPSFSSNSAVAKRFLRPDSSTAFVAIDTTQDPEGFRTAANILLTDANRLVEKKLVSAGAVVKAIEKLLDESENELFYVRGTVPPAMVASAADYEGR